MCRLNAPAPSSRRASHAVATIAAIALGWPCAASALDLQIIQPGSRQIFLQVGTGSSNANNGAVNLVSVSVPMGQVGNGTPQPMTSNSTASASFSGQMACVLPQEVYVGAWSRKPGQGGAGGNSAVLQVTTPASLTNGSATLPFSQITWTSTDHSGSANTGIQLGAFTGGTQQLATVGANRWVENCLAFSYANTVVPGTGTFTGRAVYTLVDP